MLRPLNSIFPIENYPALLVGLTQPDDAAVYRLDDTRAIVSTVDFFPPVVDDPYAFGAIAAANALSDIYAMGAEPLFAINLAAYPAGGDLSILSEIMRGGAEKVREAGAVIAGGHTITDDEPKYGLAVTGLVDPARILAKGGIQAGDHLILTKALGTGVITTAHKRDQVEMHHLAAAVESMSRLNKWALDAARSYTVHAATDVTGYSLLGHAHEMAHLSHVDIMINFEAIEWLPGALDYGRAGIFPGGTERNEAYYGAWTVFDDGIQQYERKLLFDAQTSGGLLLAVSAEESKPLLDALRACGENAAHIGAAVAGQGMISVNR